LIGCAKVRGRVHGELRPTGGTETQRAEVEQVWNRALLDLQCKKRFSSEVLNLFELGLLVFVHSIFGA